MGNIIDTLRRNQIKAAKQAESIKNIIPDKNKFSNYIFILSSIGSAKIYPPDNLDPFNTDEIDKLLSKEK